MGSTTQSTVTYEGSLPAFTGFWSGLRAMFRRAKDTAREQEPAGWPDELNDHYFRDAGLEHGRRDVLSEQTLYTLYALHMGPRA